VTDRDAVVELSRPAFFLDLRRDERAAAGVELIDAREPLSACRL
jgi:hypothetical protein